MSVRNAFIVDDLSKVFKALFESYTTSPWDRWNVTEEYPGTELFAAEPMPIIYFYGIQKVDEIRQMGGTPRNRWVVQLGVWVNVENGGAEERRIMESQIMALLDASPAFSSKTFTVTLGATTYTAKTLKQLGVGIDSYTGFVDLPVENNSEFRSETSIYFIA